MTTAFLDVKFNVVAAPTPPPSGVIPLLPISTTNPNWPNLLKWSKANPPIGQGPASLLSVWVAEGKVTPSLRDTAVAKVKATIAAMLADWNAGKPVGGTSGDHNVAYDSYLYAGDTLGSVITVLSNCRDQFTADEIAAAEMICEQAAFNVWNPSQASWNGVKATWSGWSINDPLNNYWQRSFFPLTCLWAKYSGKQVWLDKLAEIVALWKQKYALLVGGGSPEGTGYGQADVTKAMMNVWLCKVCFGIDIIADIRVPEHVAYWAAVITPDFKYLAYTGDGDQVVLNGQPGGHYERQTFYWGNLLSPNSEQNKVGQWSLGKLGVLESRPEYTAASCIGNPVAGQAPSYKSYFAPYVGHLFAWDDAGSYLFMECGNNVQSHSFLSQTQFQLYVGGKWLILNTSARSNSGIRQATSDCNVVVFRDSTGKVLSQKRSQCSMTVADDGNLLTANADATAAYAGSFVTDCRRSLTWDRANRKISVADTFTALGVSGEFSLNSPIQPTQNADGSWEIGVLTVRCAQPGSVVDVNTIDGSDVPAGKCWRLAFTSGNGYSVELSW